MGSDQPRLQGPGPGPLAQRRQADVVDGDDDHRRQPGVAMAGREALVGVEQRQPDRIERARDGDLPDQEQGQRRLPPSAVA